MNSFRNACDTRAAGGPVTRVFVVGLLARLFSFTEKCYNNIGLSVITWGVRRKGGHNVLDTGQ